MIMGGSVKAVLGSAAVCGVLLIAGCDSGTMASTPSAATPAAVPEVSTAAPAPSAPMPSASAKFRDTPVGVLLTGVQDALSEHSDIETEFDWTNPTAKFAEVNAAFEKLEASYTLLRTAVDAIQSQSELGSDAPKLDRLREYVDSVGPFLEAGADYYRAIEECLPIVDEGKRGDCGATAYVNLYSKFYDAAVPLIAASVAIRDAN